MGLAEWLLAGLLYGLFLRATNRIERKIAALGAGASDDHDAGSSAGLKERLAHALEDIERLTEERDTYRCIAETRDIDRDNLPVWRKLWEGRPYRNTYESNCEALRQDLVRLANGEGEDAGDFRLRIRIRPLAGWVKWQEYNDEAAEELFDRTHTFEGDPNRIQQELMALVSDILDGDGDDTDAIIFEVDAFIPETNTDEDIRIVEVAVVETKIVERIVHVLADSPAQASDDTKLLTIADVRAVVDAELELRTLEAKTRLAAKTG